MTIASAVSSSLSDDELRIEREKLEIWCTPQEFHDKVDALAGKFSLEERFNSPRLAFLRDAILLTEFAFKLGGATSVRLAAASDQFPDGYVTMQGSKTLKVEVTEADHEDRRRGDEYKDSGKAKERPSDDSEGVNVIAKELERVIQLKARKRYNPKPTLVVWLNLDKQEIEESDVVAALQDTRRNTRDHSKRFLSFGEERSFEFNRSLIVLLSGDYGSQDKLGKRAGWHARRRSRFRDGRFKYWGLASVIAK
jgi:hypothetical protein